MKPLPSLLLALSLLAPSLLALAWTASARADAPGAARCTVRIVHALPGEGGIDPAITRLRPYLENPPFNTWHNFKLLSEKEEQLRPGASAAYPSPNGKTATVTYTEHATPAGKHTVRGVFEVEHARSKSKTGFALDEGKFFLVAGEKFNGGILIYSLSCKTED
jgi:hypothetical protein